ncbi:MAG: site-specific integrase [Actinomycetota bacterium]|nr:site-specific integrase [Actinomycetota bacterium]
MKAFVRTAELDSLVDAYTRSLTAAGLSAGFPNDSVARSFFVHVGIASWQAMPLAEQLTVPGKYRRVVSWLLASQRMQPTAAYLAVARPWVGVIGRYVHAEFYARFRNVAAGVGFAERSIDLQWAALMKVAALKHVAPDRLTRDLLHAGRDELIAAIKGHCPVASGHMWITAALFRAEASLFHAGVLAQPPGRRGLRPTPTPAQRWAHVTPGLAHALLGYLDQIMVSLRPSTVARAETILREFAGFVTDTDPAVARVGDLRRAHIEAYKLHLNQRPSITGAKLSKSSLGNHLGVLRSCLERLTEWDGADRPSGVLVFSGDLPRLDDPLPRFLDDGAATKLLQAARSDEDPFVRLAVEFLARTGMRKGEFVDLTVDSIVQIGSAFWLRVPLGKLRNDRYIPLHPQLKTLLDDWLALRPDGLRSNYLFIENGRRITKSRVEHAVHKTAANAGIGHVTPHQLRHTLATQAINRGMSLEALAALLGHRSLRMTLVYARIADRKVADEYFSVSEQVEALYDQPRQLPADAEGAEMLKLRREMHQRMLGNGYCARPVGLDCHFESICESCTFFQTTIEFRPTLQRQRDDAADKGQVGRQKIFDGLLQRLQETAS